MRFATACLRYLALPAVAAASMLGAEARADENYFGYVYGSETLPRGGLEAYQWITRRAGKGQGSYTAYDFNTELEYGFTDRFQASLYLNAEHHKIRGAAPLDENGNAEFPDRDRWGFKGVAIALKYALLSPYKDGIGLALYFEPFYSRIKRVQGIREENVGAEMKLIVQKNFMDDQLIWATNFTLEPEWRKFVDTGARETEIEAEVTSGLSYRFAPNWFAGFEARYHSEYPKNSRTRFQFKDREHYALFGGPNLHYASKQWWWTLTWLPQWTGRPVDTTRSTHLHLDGYERSEIRLKVGYYF